MGVVMYGGKCIADRTTFPTPIALTSDRFTPEREKRNLPATHISHLVVGSRN